MNNGRARNKAQQNVRRRFDTCGLDILDGHRTHSLNNNCFHGYLLLFYLARQIRLENPR
jgi:hypothetical protein